MLAELRVPFTTIARMPSGNYALLSGELLLREDGDLCGECGALTSVRVESFDVGRQGTRWLTEQQWDAANAKHIEWLSAQKRTRTGPNTARTHRGRG